MRKVTYFANGNFTTSYEEAKKAKSFICCMEEIKKPLTEKEKARAKKIMAKFGFK